MTGLPLPPLQARVEHAEADAAPVKSLTGTAHLQDADRHSDPPGVVSVEKVREAGEIGEAQDLKARRSHHWKGRSQCFYFPPATRARSLTRHIGCMSAHPCATTYDSADSVWSPCALLKCPCRPLFHPGVSIRPDFSTWIYAASPYFSNRRFPQACPYAPYARIAHA